MMGKRQSLLRRLRKHVTVSWRATKGASGGQPLSQIVGELENELRSIELSLRAPVGEGMPQCFVGARTFTPETTTFNVQFPYVGASRTGAPLAVAYVVRDAETYKIPIRIAAEGVFLAKYLVVHVVQRIWKPGFGAQHVPLPTNYVSLNGSQAKWSTSADCWQSTLFPYGFNYFWNIEDTKSNRLLSDDLMSHLVLLPRAFSTFGGLAQPTRDGDLFEFETPWLLERDGQVDFHFRPINPVVQFGNSISGATAGFGYEDRENGVRNQAVSVYVELHGHRYTTDQDAIRAGALTRQGGGF